MLSAGECPGQIVCSRVVCTAHPTCSISTDGASGFRSEVSDGASKHALQSYSRSCRRRVGPVRHHGEHSVFGSSPDGLAVAGIRETSGQSDALTACWPAARGGQCDPVFRLRAGRLGHRAIALRRRWTCHAVVAEVLGLVGGKPADNGISKPSLLGFHACAGTGACRRLFRQGYADGPAADLPVIPILAR